MGKEINIGPKLGHILDPGFANHYRFYKKLVEMPVPTSELFKP